MTATCSIHRSCSLSTSGPHKSLGTQQCNTIKVWHGICRHHAAKRQAEWCWRASSGQPWGHWDSLATAFHHPSGQRDDEHPHPGSPVPQEGCCQVSRGEPTAAPKSLQEGFAVAQCSSVFLQNTTSMYCNADTIASAAVACNSHAGRDSKKCKPQSRAAVRQGVKEP